MTEATDPRAHLSVRLRNYLADLFSPNWSLCLASAALSYEHLEAAGIPSADCDALGKLCLAHGYTDIWVSRPGGEEAAETLLQAMKCTPPGPQRPGVVAAIARDFARRGLLSDGLAWLKVAVEHDTIEQMRIEANNVAAAVLMTPEARETAVEAGIALGTIKPAGEPQ